MQFNLMTKFQKPTTKFEKANEITDSKQQVLFIFIKIKKKSPNL